LLIDCFWKRWPDAPGADVLIVGAGPTGLVLALWLTHLGVKVRVVTIEVHSR
jgi:2-polyprenyl-6-methoxyphenol hydroxylase-like FAD-dependent oxidoreductase